MSEVGFLCTFGIMPLTKYWYCLMLCFLTDIDQEGVIAADMDPAQEMGDESIEVFYLVCCSAYALCAPVTSICDMAW